MIQTITADGDYSLAATTNITAIYVSGDLGSAVAYFAYKDAATNPQPLSGGGMITGQQYKIEHGLAVEIFVIVEGSNGATSIEVLSEAA